MANYLLYGTKLIEDDSTLEKFARSVCSNLDIHYTGETNYDDYKDEMMDYIEESIRDDISRTDIDYEELMYNYRNEIGDLLYEMDSNGYEIREQPLFFFGEKAKESFETLLYKYISINFRILSL